MNLCIKSFFPIYYIYSGLKSMHHTTTLRKQKQKIMQATCWQHHESVQIDAETERESFHKPDLNNSVFLEPRAPVRKATSHYTYVHCKARSFINKAKKYLSRWRTCGSIWLKTRSTSMIQTHSDLVSFKRFILKIPPPVSVTVIQDKHSCQHPWEALKYLSMSNTLPLFWQQ